MSEPGPQRGPRLRGSLFHSPWRVAAALVLMACALAIHAAVPEASAGDGRTTLRPLLLFLGLLVCSGLISSSETALFSLDKLDLSQLRNSESLFDRLTVRLIDRSNDTLITILILNNFTNIAVTLCAAILTDRLLGSAGPEAFAVAAGLATAGILMFGEILPKIVAHSRRREVSRVLVVPLAVAAWVLMPARVLINVLLGGLYRLFRIPERSADAEVSEEELKVMISSGEVSSVLEEDEREMIDGIFELRHTQVDEILTPRTGVFAVSDDLDQEAMVERLRLCPTSRVPVFHETLDEVTGFLLVKEVMLDPGQPWQTFLREPLCVPEQMGLLDLLKTFRQQRTKIAMVLDEYGGLAGVVSLQDVLEEVVGDIYEQHEQPPVEIEAVSEDTWHVDGSVHLAELGETLAMSFPPHRGRTAGGFVMNMLGRLPKVGDELAHEGITLRVREMIGRRVSLLEIHREPRDEDEELERTRASHADEGI